MSSIMNSERIPPVLSTLPLELLRMILDKVYEEPWNLSITRSCRSIASSTSTLPTSAPLLSRRFHEESLDAIRRSTNNIITFHLYANLSDLESWLPSRSLTSFLQSVTTLNLTDFPYDSSILKSWKQTCPSLKYVNVSHVYSPTTNPIVHRTLMTSSYTSLLGGDADMDFAKEAITHILTIHPTFHLTDLPDGLTLTVPNVIDFWLDRWEREYYHDNRVLIFSLTITNTTTYISNKSFKNRLRNIPYKTYPLCKELPRFPGVDYEVKYVEEGNVKNPDYDWVKDCFCSPYS